ncbi:Fic family protein [Rhodocyclaceae bacterium]
MSRYDGSDSYVFPGTTVLRNKAEIRDQAALDAYEADATALRILEMIDRPIPGRFDLEHLCAMHAYMFQDVYDWAGRLRTVDISRGDSRFANFGLIEDYLGKKLRGVEAENFLRDLPPPDFISRLAHYMAEINAAHPFREGNGRVQRFYGAQLADQADYFIDFDSVSRDEMYAVMAASFRGDEAPLAALMDRITVAVEP